MFVKLSVDKFGIIHTVSGEGGHRREVALAALIKLVRGFGVAERVFKLLTDDQATFLERFNFVCRSDFELSTEFGNDVVIRFARILGGKFIDIICACESGYDREAKDHQK